MANFCKSVSVLGVLIFLKLSSHVSGEITAEAVYETLSYSIFKIKTDMENLKRRFENMEEKGQRISTTSLPQLERRPFKEEDIVELKEYLSLQALAIKKTLAAEKILLRETVESFEVKFAEFKSEVQKDITSFNTSLAAFKSEIQKDFSSINASLEGKAEAMIVLVNSSSNALEKGIAKLTTDLTYTTNGIKQSLEAMETKMMSNFGDTWTSIANITLMLDINECTSSPCQNDGSCIDKVNGYKCSCRDGWTGTHCQEARFDCRAIDVTGIYTIQPLAGKPQNVVCRGGGWTVIQQRRDGSVDFYRTWQEYKDGFGSASSEYWIGNDATHALTQSGRCELRIEVTSLSGNKTYANYSSFFIDDEAHMYRLNISGYSGTAGDCLISTHNGFPLSTKDRDNDSSGANCAQLRHAGYWYNQCNYSNLNGNYQVKRCCDGFYWNPGIILSESTMLIKC